MKRWCFFVLMAVTMCAAVSSPAFGQTSAFTYQGSLTEMSGKADGLYDFLFSLYDGETGNGLLGQSELTNVQVSGGLFDVELDFGADVFDTDADRFLEIRVRPSGQQTYETLTPRVKITSAPTAVVAKRAGFASTAGYAQNGPFEPLDTTPPADCGARPGEYQVITQLDTPHGSFQGVDVAYPVKLERIYTFLPTTGDVLVGDFTNVTIRVSRLYDPASNWYNTVFQQGDTGLTLTIQMLVPAGSQNNTTYQFSNGIVSGWNLKINDQSQLEECLTITFVQQSSQQTAVSRSSQGIDTNGFNGGYQPTLGGSASPLQSNLFYEIDGSIPEFSSFITLPIEMYGGGSPNSIPEAVSFAINAFTDPNNNFFDAFVQFAPAPVSLRLVDPAGHAIWTPDRQTESEFISWTLHEDEFGGLIEEYSVIYPGELPHP